MGQRKSVESNLAEELYDLVRVTEDRLYVHNTVTDEYELWVLKQDNPSFSLIHEGNRYEFTTSNVTRTEAHGKCDNCIAVTINGVICHEAGCYRQKEETRNAQV